MSILEKLMAIQDELRAPKDAYNSFGKYSYRSAESILIALKPLLKTHGATIVISDSMKEIGGRVYVEANACLTCVETNVSTSCTASAREPESRKGMDESQITGAASSYARKYALCGLLAIDDNKDADSMKPATLTQDDLDKLVEGIGKAVTMDELRKLYNDAVKACNEAGDTEARNVIVTAKDAQKSIIESAAKDE
jgi:hypothetical protein